MKMNHFGISVTSLEEAIDFYTKTFDFKVPKKEKIDTECSSMSAKIFKDIFKSLLKKVNVAWLNTDNRVGLEIFEFVDPKAKQPADIFEGWRKHFFHICITSNSQNIDKLCEKIIQNGGTKHSEFRSPVEDKEYKLVYCKDPFGNFIEIFTDDYESFILGKVSI